MTEHDICVGMRLPVKWIDSRIYKAKILCVPGNYHNMLLIAIQSNIWYILIRNLQGFMIRVFSTDKHPEMDQISRKVNRRKSTISAITTSNSTATTTNSSRRPASSTTVEIPRKPEDPIELGEFSC